MTTVASWLLIFTLPLGGTGLELTRSLARPAPNAIPQLPPLPGPADSERLKQSLSQAEAARLEGVRTGNTTFFQKSYEASENALDASPANLQAQRLRIRALLGLQRFQEALALARELNRSIPDDLDTYGFVAEASLTLGDYPAAEEAVQWMLDLRPSHPAARMLGARLRELFGDLDGAVQFLNDAWPLINPQQRDVQAEALTHLARLLHQQGLTEAAEEPLQRALETFPDFHRALQLKAEILLSRNRREEAVALLQKRLRNNPAPSARYDLCLALSGADNQKEAAGCFDEFEQEALRSLDQPVNANLELVFYYSDRKSQPARALEIARQEVQRRQDVATRHALAWALQANGASQEALAEIESILALGLRQPVILKHAEIIRQAVRRSTGPP